MNRAHGSGTPAFLGTALLVAAGLLVWLHSDNGLRRSTPGPRASASPPASVSSAPASAADSAGATTAPFDVHAVVRQVSAAFRPQGQVGVWSSVMRNYAIEVDSEAATLRVVLPRDPALPSQPPPTLTLRAPMVRRGATSLTNGSPATPTLASDGHLQTKRDEVIEHWRNSDSGVEQSWQLLHAPQGDGDLHVRIETGGLPFAVADDIGLHFADASTGVGFVYGHATWIDAAGVRTAVPVEYDDGAVSLRVPSRTLETSRYPAVLDPLVSPEIALGVPLPAGPTLDEQGDPQVAYGGGNYLVTWEHVGVNGWSPYAARVTPQGVLLDPSGIPLTQGSGNYGSPTVAFNGTHFLTVFPSNPASGAADLYAARVSTGGVLIDTDLLVIDTSDNCVLPAIAVSGSTFLVVWEEQGASSNIRGARVTSAGSVSASFTIAGGTHYEVRPRVASNGSGYLVVWDDNRSGNLDIYGARVSAAGSVVDAGGFPISVRTGTQSYPAVASQGADYLVVWQDSRSGGGDIYGARIVNGAVVGGDSLLISGATGAQSTPDIAWNGTHYLAAWADTRLNASGSDIYGARVSSDATVVETTGILISTAATRQITPRVASGSGDFLVVWRESRNDATVPGADYDVYGARVSSAGSLVDSAGILISATANMQEAPAVAFNGTHYLVVWSDNRNNRFSDIYGARVDVAGAVLDPNGIGISTAAYFQSWPTVAANGGTFLVTWTDNRNYPAANDIYAARVAGDGAVLDPGGIAIATDLAAQLHSVVASNGTEYLIAWTQEETPMGNRDVYARRLDSTGAWIDASAFPISAVVGSTQQTPMLASNGADYFAVWSDSRSMSGFASPRAFGSRISRQGVVLDINGIALCDSATSQGSPRVEFDGSTYLAAWSDRRNGARDVFGTRVTTAGNVLNPAGLALVTSGTVSGFDFACGVGGCLLVWVDNRDYAPIDPDHNVYGTRIRDGVSDQPLGFVLGNTPLRRERSVAIAAGSPRTFLTAYDLERVENANAVLRSFARRVEIGHNGEPCDQVNECGSGHCIDGVCCNVACGGDDSLDCQACSIAAGALVDGTCANTSNNACDDASHCTVTDTCNTGVCIGAVNPCFSSTLCSEQVSTYSCGPCPAGTSSASGTGLTACLQCAPGTFASAPGTTQCTPVRQCNANEYQVVSPTATRDRACMLLSVCSNEQYELAAATPISDRVCADATTCDEDEYEAAPLTPTSDRICGPLRVCTEDEYEAAPPTATLNRLCVATTPCADGQFEQTPPTANRDRICRSCTLCVPNAVVVAACDETSDTVCMEIDPNIVVDSGFADSGFADGGFADGGKHYSDANVPMHEDAGARDAAIVDAALPDSTTIDAAIQDASLVDGAVQDASATDAAHPADASLVDGAVQDASLTDAAHPTDATVDAASPRPDRRKGCRCGVIRATPDGPYFGWAAVGALLGLGRMRSKGRARGTTSRGRRRRVAHRQVEPLK